MSNVIHRDEIIYLPLIGTFASVTVKTKRLSTKFDKAKMFAEWINHINAGSIFFQEHANIIINFLSHIKDLKLKQNRKIEKYWRKTLVYLDSEAIVAYLLHAIKDKDSDAITLCTELLNYINDSIRNQEQFNYIKETHPDLLAMAPVLNDILVSVSQKNDNILDIAYWRKISKADAIYDTAIENLKQYCELNTLLNYAKNDVGLAVKLMENIHLIPVNQTQQLRHIVALIDTHHKNLYFMHKFYKSHAYELMQKKDRFDFNTSAYVYYIAYENGVLSCFLTDALRINGDQPSTTNRSPQENVNKKGKQNKEAPHTIEPSVNTHKISLIPENIIYILNNPSLFFPKLTESDIGEIFQFIHYKNKSLPLQSALTHEKLVANTVKNLIQFNVHSFKKALQKSTNKNLAWDIDATFLPLREIFLGKDDDNAFPNPMLADVIDENINIFKPLLSNDFYKHQLNKLNPNPQSSDTDFFASMTNFFKKFFNCIFCGEDDKQEQVGTIGGIEAPSGSPFLRFYKTPDIIPSSSTTFRDNIASDDSLNTGNDDINDLTHVKKQLVF